MQAKSLRISSFAFAVALMALAAAGIAWAADAATSDAKPQHKVVAIGEAAPAWQNLIGIDDQTHSLSDLSAAKAVVVVFTCNHCPVAQAYQDRLVQLAADFGPKSVEVVAINVNNGNADKLPAMKQRAEEKGFKFNYFYDPTQTIAREYGATVTPHAFVLDGNRNVVYMGAIDDNMNADKVSQHYVRDAVDAVLAGQAPTTTTSKQFGCGIQYE